MIEQSNSELQEILDVHRLIWFNYFKSYSSSSEPADWLADVFTGESKSVKPAFCIPSYTRYDVLSLASWEKSPSLSDETLKLRLYVPYARFCVGADAML